MSLDVEGPALDADTFTQRAGVEPTSTRRVGDRTGPRRGDVAATGRWQYSLVGPTPYEAPFVADKLAAELRKRLAKASAPWPDLLAGHDARVRFAFDVPYLLTFSWVLAAETIAGLAVLGAPLEFVVRDTAGRAGERAFASNPEAEEQASVALVIDGETLDPAEISARLGLEPTFAHRAGEVLSQATGRRSTFGQWQHEVSGDAPADAAALARTLLARLPPAVSSALASWPEHGARVRICYLVGTLWGRATLDAATAGALATLGCPIEVYISNFEA